LKPEVYSYQITVPSSAIDERDHVNNLAYLQWCMDAAQGHWERNASATLRESYVWYVLKHIIDYKASAYEGEELRVETWVTSAEGVKSERQYRIFRIKDNKLLIEASTIWCFLNAKNLKPTKIPSEIRTLFEEK
jgi:acyl-CoA thioester hydrolase